MAAKSIVFAADHPRRREYWVGTPTVGTLLANRVVPGLLDHYLARTGYRSQQTDQPRDPDRPANLWDPADDTDEPDFGAHGSFDDRSFGFSPQLWLSQHRGPAAAGLASLAAATLAIRRRRS